MLNADSDGDRGEDEVHAERVLRDLHPDPEALIAPTYSAKSRPPQYQDAEMRTPVKKKGSADGNRR